MSGQREHPPDAVVAKDLRALVGEYEAAGWDHKTKPLQVAALEALGWTEQLPHDVAFAYLRDVRGLPREIVAWIDQSPAAVEYVFGKAKALAAVELPSGPNPEARERERLRHEARDGACPVCGRWEHKKAVQLIDAYSGSLARAHVTLAKAQGRAADLLAALADVCDPRPGGWQRALRRGRELARGEA